MNKAISYENFVRGIELSQILFGLFHLDLSGLRVVTECANGSYAFTAVMARLAGASVYAVGKNSRFGSFDDNRQLLNNIFKELRITDGFEIFYNKIPNSLWQVADIVLNNGFVRPITKKIIQCMKSTAVIPLMWEPWEVRHEDIDIKACQKYHIPIIGTNESFHLIKTSPYNGMIALKLLFEMGIEVHNNEIVLLGGYKTGKSIAATFEKLGVSYSWFTPTGTEKESCCYSYDDLPRLLSKENIDAIICAEHYDHRCLIGKTGYIDFPQLKVAHPYLRWGHICGHIDDDSLQQSGLFFFPKNIRPKGYMSYQAFNLGIRPVLELNAAGLKVGEIAARARLAGATVEEAIQKTVDYGIGMDFEGKFLSYEP